MKIPSKHFDPSDQEGFNKFYEVWGVAATQISMEYGIFVEVKTEAEFDGKKRIQGRYEVFHPEQVIRIFFKTMDQEFESLNHLRRALNNKAFL